jgi:hypothetical protein
MTLLDVLLKPSGLCSSLGLDPILKGQVKLSRLEGPVAGLQGTSYDDRRLRHAPQFVEERCAQPAREMFQCVKRNRGIERVIREWQLARIGAHSPGFSSAGIAQELG